MPHRLRKVFSVNIRNASTNAASQQIALLDLRAHTMAIGENGVGKSSFMRLIPLFYGASPERILRGTQKHHLIGYTLPGPSSAVAFEYERETEDDLRLAVMFAKPGAERPEFMIVEGGYKESYFVDENGDFVDRDRFKDRLEAMNIEVSPRFELHEYRSVILYEHRHTKEARSLRPWAARHSLGPSSLFGLDLIAVAMTSEKITFRDLQNLVLERLNDSAFEGARNSNARLLRKDRKDVDSWLANVKHAKEVLNDTARKKVIEEQAGKVGQIALDLGSLRAACDLSIDHRVAALDQLGLELGKLTVAMHDLEQSAAEGAAMHARAVSESKNELASATAAVEEIQGKDRHFTYMGIKGMVAEHALQGQYTHDKQVATTERNSLTERANDAQQALQVTLSNLERDLQTRKGQIQTQRETATRECETQVAAVEEERNGVVAELDSTPAAPRLVEIDELIAQHRGDVGSHETLARVAEAPKEAQEHLASAEASLAQANQVLSERKQHVERTSLEVKSGDGLRTQTLHTLDQMEAQLADAAARHEVLQAQLNPPAGSVLATLRAQPAELWTGAAKVLDPERLLRTDLTARFEDDALHVAELTQQDGSGSEKSEEVNVGPLRLNVAPIELPQWATQDGARARIAASAANLESIRARHKEAYTAAKNAQADLDAARKALQTGEHELNRATTNQVDTAEAVVRAKKHVVLELERVRKGHAEEVAKLRSAVSALSSERNTLMKDEQARRGSVLRQLDERINKLRTQRDDALAQLTGEAGAADSGAKEQRVKAQEAHDRILEGLGVDPAKVQTLNERIGVLDAKLVAIAQNAHNVAAWRKFELELLPLKPEREAREQELRRRAEAAADEKTKFEKGLMEKRAALTTAEAKARFSRNATQEELDNLRRLRTQSLAPYLLQGPAHVGDDAYYTLSTATKTRLDMLGTATQRLESVTRDLCSRMRERQSSISQWLDGAQAAHNALVQQREQDGLGDAYLPHERAVDWGRAVCDWFEPLTHRQYHIALRHEMDGYFAAAESFINHIANFESRVDELNRQFQRALNQATGFKRFNNLQIKISSSATSSPTLKALREMRDVSLSRLSSHRTALAANPQLPSEEDVALVRSFRDQIPDTGTLSVDLDEHVRLAFELEEMGRHIRIDNDRSMQGLSSTGLTVLITMMFLLGFLGIVRGPRSPVGMTWVLDEVGRVSPSNMLQYLDALTHQNVTAVCAAPSIDPALGALFASAHLFEDDGSLVKSNADDEEIDLEAEETMR
ncbi:ATP-binding protein [Acidovorax sp. SUPP3334]|uniref:ATP-binding protein n=1 Tax=Acidovorax sp. SUPP3334 TaxID=2920881 RepID=UPI0023DE2906|nr:ATP-binding protein [Acidovorax sp. SUPP3334]GKT26059.1 ATP-binding protein [Acidovorax sp. SUPP3334]